MTQTADRGRLTREGILDAGISIADGDGIDALSMRRLAGALGVEAMSIYHHIPNKATLIDAMADRVFAQIELPEHLGDWREAVSGCAVAAHRVLMAHPWAAWLVMSPASSASPQPARSRYINWLLGLLTEAGFEAELTYRGYHAIDAHILGFTAWHLGHASGLKTVLAGRELEELVEEFIASEGAALPHLAEHARRHLEHGPGDGHQDYLFGLGLILDGLERSRTA